VLLLFIIMQSSHTQTVISTSASLKAALASTH